MWNQNTGWNRTQGGNICNGRLNMDLCTNGGVHCVMYKYIRETPDKHGVRMPMHFESAWFLGGSAMKVEPKYWAVAITRWKYL